MKRRSIALLLCLMLVCALAAPAAAAQTGTSEDIVILYTNDVHTYIDGPLSYDVISGIKKELETQYAHVLLVDAGDHVQGTAYGSMDKGETIIQLMNAAGYDLATLGNHEFDYGMDGCMQIVQWAQYPYVSCNFYEEVNGVREENVLPSYQIFDCGTEKLAIVGITTPESFTKSTPSYFQDESGNYIYGISGGEDGLLDPKLMSGMSAAAEKIKAAVESGKKILIFGDYDADGISASAILKLYFDSVGADSFVYLPKRSEGYGLKIETMMKLKKRIL